jgi:ribosomal protein S18 acetylase RimI-like enzyme
MNRVIHMREFRWPDFDAVAAVWKSADRDVPPRAELESKLLRDPQLFLVAEEGGSLVGVVLGICYGWRGWMLRLAVEPA